MKLGGPLKEKCITVIFGPFESKLFSHYNCCWEPFWKQSSPLIHCSYCWALFESKVGYFAHHSCKGGARGKCLACVHLNTPLYITLTMILYENMKPFEHALLHPICELSHLMCACKHCKVIFILLNTLKLLMSLPLQKYRYHAIFHDNLGTQVD